MNAILKLPPHAIEPEQSVLGGLLISPKAAVAVFGLIRPDDFYRRDHQTIAATVLGLHERNKPHDFLAVTETLRDAGRLEEAGGVSYIGQLASDASTANVEAHAAIVRDKAARRRVIALCSEVSDAAYRSDADNLTGMLSTGVENLLKGAGSQSQKFAELLGPTEAHLKAAGERRKAGGTLGVGTGLPGLDKVTGGIYGPRVYGIAARPSTGKTAVLNQIAFHAALRGSPGLILSLEMGAEELMIRGLSSYSKRNVTRLFHGHDEDAEAAMEAGARLGDLPLWIDTQTYGLNAILSQIAAHKHRHGIKWAAIDHVGLIETEKFNSRNDQIGHITRKLKQCAKQLSLPIIALFQLSRLSEKENRQPGLHDLRDSGNIEQDLDVALFLHVEPANRDKPTKPVKLGVLKNRNGRVGWLTENFEFDGAVQTFREIASGYGAGVAM